jgi:hypothetical protein
MHLHCESLPGIFGFSTDSIRRELPGELLGHLFLPTRSVPWASSRHDSANCPRPRKT